MPEEPKQPYEVQQKGHHPQAGYFQQGQAYVRQNEGPVSQRDPAQFGQNARRYQQEQHQNIPQHNQMQPDPRQNWQSDKEWY